jgi:hypothetical protein
MDSADLPRSLMLPLGSFLPLLKNYPFIISLLTQELNSPDKSSSTSKISGHTGRSNGSMLPQQDPDNDPKKGRIQKNAEDVINYFKKLKREGWEFHRKSPNKRHTAYINRTTKEIRYNDNLHNEVECFDKRGNHSVRDPITNELLNKPPHQLPDWLK